MKLDNIIFTIIGLLAIAYLGSMTYNEVLDSKKKNLQLPQQLYDTTHVEVCDTYKMVYDTTFITDTIPLIDSILVLDTLYTMDTIPVMDTIAYFDTIEFYVTIKESVIDTIIQTITIVNTVIDTISVNKTHIKTPSPKKKVTTVVEEQVTNGWTSADFGLASFLCFLGFVMCFMVAVEHNEGGCLTVGVILLIICIILGVVASI